MGIFTGLALGASALFGGIGALQQASAQERAAALQEKGIQEFLKLQIPDPDQLKLALDRFVSTGELTPEFESAIKLGESEFNDITVDPALRESRMRALAGLENIGYGGESVEDAAALEANLIRSGAANRGNQEAVLSSMARRGQLGSGLEMSARMDASQNAGDQLAMQGLSMEQDRRQRALQALMGSGELAGDIMGFDYQVDSDRAQAGDAISRFNAQNMQGVQGRNVDRGNTAQQYNLDRRQDIADRNVGLGNFEQQYNKELKQQEFQNQAAKAAGVSGQYGAGAKQAADQGSNAAAMWGGLAGGAGTLAAGFYGKDKKKEDDLDEEF